MAAAPYSWPHLRLTTHMLSTVGITDIKIIVGDQANEKFARAQTRREITGKRCYSRVNLDMNQITQLGVEDACVFLWYLVERERMYFRRPAVTRFRLPAVWTSSYFASSTHFLHGHPTAAGVTYRATSCANALRSSSV